MKQNETNYFIKPLIKIINCKAQILFHFTIFTLLFLSLSLSVFSQNSVDVDKEDQFPATIKIQDNQDKLEFSVISSSSDSQTLIAVKNFKFLGTAELTKRPEKHEFAFTTASGEFFKITQERNSETKSQDDFTVTFKTLNKSVSLSSYQILGKIPISVEKQNQLKDVLNAFILNKNLADLMKSMSLLNSANTSQTELVDNFNCVGKITGCIVAAAGWVGSWVTLGSICGPTLGAGCVAAILVHPAFAAWTAFECSAVASACGSDTPKTKSPTQS